MNFPDLKKMTPEEIQQIFDTLKAENEGLRNFLDMQKDQAELLTTITENMLDMVVMSDLEGNITFAGEAHEKLGYEKGFLIGKNVLDFVHPEHFPNMLEEFNKLLAIGGPRRVEYLYTCKDGSYKWFETIGNFIIDESNNPWKIVFSARDITERKQAEQALIKNKNMLHAMSRMAKIGGWGKNLLTGEDEWSKVTREIHEVGPDFVPDMQNAINFYKEGPNRDKIVDVVTRCIETGEPYDVEVEFITARGNERWIRTMGQAEFQDGQCIRLFGTIQDITERKQAEAEKEALETQNRLLQKAESLSLMAGAIAHQFNNQLQAVMGNIELAMDDLPRGAKILDFLEDAINASRKAQKISGQMLAYLGQANGRYVPLDLSEICRESLSLLQASAPQNIRFKADFPASSMVILGNARQMMQVLSNLVINAWEATGQKKGTITLALNKVYGMYIATDNQFPVNWQPNPVFYACLEVADEGHGIENRDIEKIFDPFFSTKFTGRGLGLPAVIGIIWAHSGGVTVESEPGRGSIFRVFLPLSNKKTT